MFRRQTYSTATPSKRRAPNKLIAGLAAVLATGIITTASFAAAATPSSKPTKEWCKQHHYTNYGQCVKVWAQAHAHTGGQGGNGYGGNGRIGDNNISLDVNLSNSKDNVINIIVNIFR